MRTSWLKVVAMCGALAVLVGPLWAVEPVAVRDKDGKVWAEVVVCNDCQTPGQSGCYQGAERGWWNGRPCGKCFVDKNFGKVVMIPYDVQITGTLVDNKGEPVKDRFVKLFVQNGWGHRTRTQNDGRFRIMTGATGDRKSSDPLVVDLGKLVDQQKDAEDRYFALYLLAPDHTPCSSP